MIFRDLGGVYVRIYVHIRAYSRNGVQGHAHGDDYTATDSNSSCSLSGENASLCTHIQ